MNRSSRSVWSVGFVVILSSLLLVAASSLPAAPESPLSGLMLKGLDGGKVKFDYGANRLTLVNFWATWCMPCREEMPQISKLVDTYGNKGFRAIGIAMESGGAKDVKGFLEENPTLGANYPIFVGDQETADRFGDIEAVPTSILIDSEGKVVRMFVGVNPDFLGKVGAEIAKHLERPAGTDPPSKP